MNIIFLSNEIKEMIDKPDTVTSIEGVDKVVPFDPPLTIDRCKVIVDQQEDLFIVVARNPQQSSSVQHTFFPVELANMGTNPGHVGFVDLNHIFLASANSEAAVNRLQIHIRLTFVKLSHTKDNPREIISPLKKIFVVGSPQGESFIEDLQKKGVKISGLWTGREFDLDGIPVGLSGLPGKYTITLQQESGEKITHEAGAMVVFNEGLDDQQKKHLLDGFLLTVKDHRLHIQPTHLRLSQGIKVVYSETEYRQVADFFCSFLSLSKISHFVEDPHIDHEKCGLCGTCVKTCLFHASTVSYSGSTGVSEIDPDFCVGCGNCVTACPTQARDLPAYSYDFFSSSWKELREFHGGTDGLKILVIYCESNGHDAIAYLSENKIKVPSSCLFFRIRCGARVDTQFVPDSFQAGFDGVAILVCSRDECNNIVGSLDLERRLNLYRKVMQATGIETGRMRIMPVASDKLETVGESLQQFADFLNSVKQDKQLFTTMAT